jgi:tRNA threonylcarbamoyladenosine biosynthesis protein TsaB
MGHVLILALDTSSAAGSLAVLRDERVIGTVSTWTKEIYSSRMFRHLDFLLEELSLGLRDFDLFAVAAGPGSFTGLRVGLTAAKGWAEVYGKPIAAVSALEAIAAQSHSHASVVVPVLDAHRGQVYFGVYRRRVAADGEGRLALDGDECVMTPEEFLISLDAHLESSAYVIIAPEPELIHQGSASRNETRRGAHGAIRVEQASAIVAPYIGRLGYQRALRGELVDALKLDANYVRRTDAELHWKAPTES